MVRCDSRWPMTTLKCGDREKRGREENIRRWSGGGEALNHGGGIFRWWLFYHEGEKIGVERRRRKKIKGRKVEVWTVIVSFGVVNAWILARIW